MAETKTTETKAAAAAEETKTTETKAAAAAEETKTADATASAVAQALAGIADAIKSGVSEAVTAASARMTNRSIVLPNAAPKDTSERVVLMAGKEAIEVPRNSAHVLEAMGWQRKGGKDAHAAGKVSIYLPGDPDNVVTVPAAQLGTFAGLGWIVKE